MPSIIANAYVEITPITPNFAAQLKRQLAASNGAAAVAGKKQGSAYGKAMVGTAKTVLKGLAVAGVASLKLAGDFQQSMSVLRTAAGESADGLKIVSKGVLDLAVSTGTTAKQLSEGAYQIEKAGYRGGAALSVLKAGAQGAREEGASLASVTDALTSVMSSYGLRTQNAALAQLRANQTMNAMRVAAGQSKTTMEQFSSSLSNVLPIAASAGVSFAEVGGAIGTLTSHGTTAQRATFDLAFVIRGLIAPNNVARNTMEQLGISSRDVAKNIGRRGLSGTLDLLSRKILTSMGPSGLVLLKSFNQSKLAAESARQEIKAMPPELSKLAREYAAGTVTQKEWNSTLLGLPPIQAAILRQFGTTENRARGFNQMLRNGTGSSITYQEALKKVTGGATGLTTALQLTGGNMVGFKQRTKAISDTSKTAGKDIQGWGIIQKNFNFKLDAMRGLAEKVAINVGTKLIPPVSALLNLMLSHQGVTTGVIAVLGVLTGAIVFDTIAMKSRSLATHASTAATIIWETWLRLSRSTLGTFIGVKAIEFGSWVRSTAATIANTAVLIAHRAVTLTIAAATRVWAIAQAALNAVMDANPITLIIIAIAALVAGIIYAYKHSEKFRSVVQAMWKGIQTAAAAAWSGIKPIIDVIVNAFKAVLPIALRAFSTYFKTVFAVISFVVRTEIAIAIFVLNNLIKFIVAVLVPVFRWLWKNIIVPIWHYIVAAIKTDIAIVIGVFHFLQAAIHVLAVVFKWLWKHVITPIWHYIVAAIKFDVAIVVGIFHFVMSAIHVLASVFKWLWSHVITPVWHGLADTIKTVWHTVIKPVFDAFKSVFGKVKDAFKYGVKHIGDAWNTLKEKTKEPVNFIIETVYNHGIARLWNKVAGIVHSPPLPDIPKLASGGTFGTFNRPTAIVGEGNSRYPEYVIPTDPSYRSRAMGLYSSLGPQLMASGGILGTIKNVIKGTASTAVSSSKGVADFFKHPLANVKSILEAPLRQLSKIKSTRFGELISHIPEMIVHKVLAWGKDKIKSVGGGGGYSPGLVGGLSWARSQAGRPYVWGATGPDGYDCSGFMSAILDVIQSRLPYTRRFTTDSLPAAGFEEGRRSGFMLGWTRDAGGGIGHVAGTINGVNVESRGGVGTIVGAGARGFRDRLFDRHAGLAGYRRGGKLGGAPFDVLDPRGRAYAGLDVRSMLMARGGKLSEGRHVADGLAMGIRSGSGDVQSASDTLVSHIIDPIRGKLQIASPSRVTKKLGHDIGWGLIAGLTSTISRIHYTTERIIHDIRDVFRGRTESRLVRFVHTENRRLLALAHDREGTATRLKAATQRLKSIQSQSRQLGEDIRSSVIDSGKITDAGADTTPDVVIGKLRAAVTNAKIFARNIANLRARGLRSDLLAQIAGEGVTGGGPAAAALAQSSKSQLKQINQMQGQLVTSAGSTSRVVADAMYGVGLHAAEGLVRGLTAHQHKVESAMLRIAELMQRVIKRALGIHSPSRKIAHHARGGVIGAQPMLFDRGGYLPPGATLAVNRTGRPERVVSPAQERRGGHGLTVHMYGTTIKETVDADLLWARWDFHERAASFGAGV